jgi:uncharacterized protein YukE
VQMPDRLKRVHRKFHKRSREARKEFKLVKDKNLGKGLVRLTRALNQIRTQLRIINKKVTETEKRSV